MEVDMAATTVRPLRVPPPGRCTEKRLTITVLRGGPSREREVSMDSGEEIAIALEACGHDVSRLDISPDDLSALDREVDVVFIGLHGQFGEDGAVQGILEQHGIRYTGSDPTACALAMNKI